MMDPDASPEAKDLAKDMIEALDKSREDRDQWIVTARTMVGGPIITVGPFSTMLQASKAMKKIAFVDPEGAGVGAMFLNMKPVSWIDKY